MSLDSHQLINQTSGETEYFTPPVIIAAARAAMGGRIELDPASSAEANKIVGAERFYTEADDGLKYSWLCDTLWMNHPFGRREEPCKPDCEKPTCVKRGWHRLKLFPGNGAWIGKFIDSYITGRMKEGCCLTFAATSENWFRTLLHYPQCFLSPRTNYLLPDGSVKCGVSKGSVVTYLGPRVERFAEAFRALGVIKIDYNS